MGSYCVLLLVNNRMLPKRIRPKWYTNLIIGFGAVFYLGMLCWWPSARCGSAGSPLPACSGWLHERLAPQWWRRISGHNPAALRIYEHYVSHARVMWGARQTQIRRRKARSGRG
jgi:hypothetical protein